MKPFIVRRKYHAYKHASQYLKIYQQEVLTKQKIIHDTIDKQANKKMPISLLFKDIKKSKTIKDAQHVKDVLDACINIERLCNQAYETFYQLENHSSEDLKLDEELVDFIQLTNQMYPCVSKDLYERLAHRERLIKLQKSS
jgi:hypothetical protein